MSIGSVMLSFGGFNIYKYKLKYMRLHFCYKFQSIKIYFLYYFEYQIILCLIMLLKLFLIFMKFDI